MDNITTECTDELYIDLESSRLTSEEGTSQSVVSGKRKDKNLVLSIASGLLRFNGAIVGDNRVNAYNNLGEPSNVSLENVEVVIGNSSGGEGNEEHMALTGKEQVKEKHKKRNHKKAPKPPRPPKAPSLDAADLKLVREISAITMKKRARNERLKALKKMEAKLLSSSPSSSSQSSSSPSSLCSGLSAMFITVLFFLVILYQGFYSGGSASVRFQGSPEPALATNSLISVQFFNNPSPNDGTGLGS